MNNMISFAKDDGFVNLWGLSGHNWKGSREIVDERTEQVVEIETKSGINFEGDG